MASSILAACCVLLLAWATEAQEPSNLVSLDKGNFDAEVLGKQDKPWLVLFNDFLHPRAPMAGMLWRLLAQEMEETGELYVGEVSSYSWLAINIPS